MVGELIDFDTVDLISILDEYYKVRIKQQNKKYGMQLMDYIKNFVI